MEEEAARQARVVEKARYRTNELMTLGYEEAMRWFEEVGASGMRASDVIQVVRLHMDYLKAFGVEPEPRNEDDWTEEDDEFVDTILKEIKSEEEPEEGSSEGEGEQG